MNTLAIINTFGLLGVTSTTLGSVLGVLSLAAVAAVLTVKRLLYLCQPNEVLIFSGRRRVAGSSIARGYRIVRGGSTLRIPLLETADRMDLTNMILDVKVTNAYSKGGIPLTVQGIANIKIPGGEPLLSNTLERFLGSSKADIMKTARETLEGNLRGVLSTLTPEEVNRDKERFARQLATEAEQDFNTLGLVLDTLKIQNVTDEVGYLDAIGRMRSAQIRRDAKIAEATASAEAAEQKWKNNMAAEISKIEAEVEITRRSQERRIADATTQRGAQIATEEAEVQAQVAQATANIQTQKARIEQVKAQLQADVIAPAQANLEQAIQRAKGEAAQIIEQGQATAKVLTDLGQTYQSAGSQARDALLMQKLIPVLELLSSTISSLQVDRMTVLGSGEGGANGKQLAELLVDSNEQVKAATGVDLGQALREKLGAGAASARPNGGPSAPPPHT